MRLIKEIITEALSNARLKFEGKTFDIEEGVKLKGVIVNQDGSEPSRKAVEQALRSAEEQGDFKISGKLNKEKL